jgi:hypothetical protein
MRRIALVVLVLSAIAAAGEETILRDGKAQNSYAVGVDTGYRLKGMQAELDADLDSSLGRERPATFALKSVIKGWSEALLLMPVGSKWQVFIPPDLAYGERGARGSIGPNTALIFEGSCCPSRRRSRRPVRRRRPRPSRTGPWPAHP